MRDRIQRKSMPANHSENDTPSPAVAEASLNPAFSGHDFANINVFSKDSVSQQESVPAQESGPSSETEARKLTPDRSRQFGSYSRPANQGHDFSSMNIFPTQPENRTGLPDQVLQRMENAFGHDFSEVRTQESAEPEKLSALAFARGNDLHFRPGAFDPHSQTGLSMIGHELAHVVQQRQGRARGARGAVLEDAGLESEAEMLGARAAGGGIVGGVVSRGVGGGVIDAPVQRVKTLLLGKNEEIDTEKMPDITNDNRVVIRNALRAVVNGKIRYMRTKKIGKGETPDTKDASEEEKAEAQEALDNIGGEEAHEDPDFRAAIESHVKTKGGTAPERQPVGLHNLAVNGTPSEKAAFSKMLKVEANADALIAKTRKGEKNETMLTKDSVTATERSLGDDPKVKPLVKNKAGKQESWISAQERTSYPTYYFHFPKTSNGHDGKKFQDTHTSGRMGYYDNNKKWHPSVGETSRKYHFSDKESLDNNFSNSHHIPSWMRRNIKTHDSFLATADSILKTPASKRGYQIYKTSWNKELKLNDEKDLKIYAALAEVHKRKIMTDLLNYEESLIADTSESESEPDPKFKKYPTLAMNADSESESEKIVEEMT
jgi:hypothetical protein